MALWNPYSPVKPPVYRRMDREPKKPRKPMGVDMTELAIARRQRIENEAFRQFVGALPCCVCGKSPCDPAHVREGMRGATGRKPDDPENVVPLCAMGVFYADSCHHQQHHSKLGEKLWWQHTGIDPDLLGTWLWEIFLAGGDRDQALRAIQQCQPVGRD